MPPIDSSRGTTADPTQAADGSGPTSKDTGGHRDAPLDQGRFAPGTILAGRYRVVGLLGLGGMGEVYRADDLRLRQSVALKLLPAALATDPDRLARFHAEVRIARRVSHPNVCRVHDIGEADGLTFLSMEYVDGEDLAALLTRVGRLPAERAVLVARQICAGLAAVHESGTLHRDLKPSNVMIDGRGHARLTDFGLAVAAVEARAGVAIAGTPAYMAPEQIAGAELTPQTDLFALGLVLYELFTGRAAFPASSKPRALEAQRTAPLPPSSHVPDLDPRIERVILKCLESAPERRPASARAVAAALSGDDALAAVIAAGETPSPQMVMAAGEGAGFKPVTALAVAALGILVFWLHVVFQDHVTLFAQIPLEKPPAALAERAGEVMRRLGYPEPRSQDFGLTYDSGFLQYIEEHDRSPRRWEVLRSGQPAAVFFWCWEDAVDGPRQPVAPVTRGSSALLAGTAVLYLDTRGRLLQFLLVPWAGYAAPEKAPDWNVPLALAGLDPAALRSVEPSSTPAVFADRRAAWEGVFPDAPRFPLRVEAAALRGRIVDFRILAPWTSGAPGQRVDLSALEGGFTALLVPVLIAGLFLARRNHRLGRGDRRSAGRVAVVAFACQVLSWLFWNVHAGSPLDQWQSLSSGLGKALFASGQLWVFYMALEPYARRRWPEALIAWSRLLAGRFRDPLVGRDLLVGVLLAPAVFALLILDHSVQVWLGQPAPRLLESPLYLTLGPQNFAFRLFEMLGLAILVGMMALLFLVLLRVLLRHQGLASAAFVVANTAILALGWGRGGRLSGADLLSYLGISALFCVVLRFGLLAAVVGVFLSLLAESPMTTDLWAWYAQPTLLMSGLFAALVGWGLYASLAGRSLEWSRLLEE